MQKIKLGALPKVQKLQLFIEELAIESERTFDTFDTVVCIPLNVTLHSGQERITNSISLHTMEEAEQVLNSQEAIQSVGSIVVFAQQTSSKSAEIVFVFQTDFDVQPSAVPSLTLDSDSSTIHCTDTTNGQRFLLSVLVITTQNLTYADGFNASFGFQRFPNLPGFQRFTPNLPIDVSSSRLQEELTELIVWKCFHQPLQFSGVRFSYETDHGGDENDDNTDAPLGYCGRYSKKNPRKVWEIDDADGPVNFNAYYVS